MIADWSAWSVLGPVTDLPVVEVRWRDACLRTTSRSLQDAINGEPNNRRSVGYLLVKTGSKLTIAMTDDMDGEVDDVLTLPLDWVTEVSYLRNGRS